MQENKSKKNEREEIPQSGRAGKRFERGRPPVDLMIDYKDPLTLRRFISETGKITPRRVSRLSARQQRKVATAIKRCRHLALLPYTSATARDR